jgi:hypothetical protein
MVDDQTQSGRRNGAVATTLVLVLAATLVVLGSCGSSSSKKRTTTERLTAEDFRDTAAASAREPIPIPVYVPEQPRAARVQIRSLTEAQAREGVPGVDVRVGEPVLSSRRQQPGGELTPQAPRQLDPDELTLVDSKVGDLNGLPVLARTWLEPMGDRLRAESRGLPRTDWQTFAATEIHARLVGDLRDELYLAEARSNLTAQEKAGLRVFLKRFEKDIIRSAYGSETRANQQMQRAAGVDLEAVKREREKRILIQTQMQQKVWDRVQVTWRDLELEYERNFEKYNPNPRAVFRQIRVPSADADAVAAITEALEDSPFPTVADSDPHGTKSPVVREIENGYENTVFFGIDALQAAAVGLSPGELAGPIDDAPFTYWIYLDRIESESRSLYEVQQELRQQITNTRREEEASRYLLRLFERAGISGLNHLVFRLVVIAEKWYYEGEAG